MEVQAILVLQELQAPGQEQLEGLELVELVMEVMVII